MQDPRSNPEEYQKTSDKKHLVDEVIKFPSILSENAKLAFFEEACVPMGFQEMFSNR